MIGTMISDYDTTTLAKNWLALVQFELVLFLVLHHLPNSYCTISPFVFAIHNFL